MSIEMKYSGKDDKVGKCVVTVGGKTKITGEGEQARIVAMIEIETFEKRESDKKELAEAYDDLLGKAKDGFTLNLWEEGIPIEGVETAAAKPKPARYKALIDDELVYSGDDLQELRNRISNIPNSSFGP